MSSTNSTDNIKLKLARCQYNYAKHGYTRIKEMKNELAAGKLKYREPYRELMEDICLVSRGSDNLPFRFASDAAAFCKQAGAKISHAKLIMNAGKMVRTQKFLNEMECIWEEAFNKAGIHLRDVEARSGIVHDDEDDETSLV